MHRLAFAALLCLTSCAAAQKPQPVGEPGPIACVGAKSAMQAWLELDAYMRQVLEAQQAYSCSPVAPAPATPPPSVPALR